MGGAYSLATLGDGGLGGLTVAMVVAEVWMLDLMVASVTVFRRRGRLDRWWQGGGVWTATQRQL